MLALLKNQIVWKYLSMTKLKFIAFTTFFVFIQPVLAEDSLSFEAELKALENRQFVEEEKGLSNVEALVEEEQVMVEDSVSFAQSSTQSKNTEEYLVPSTTPKIRRIRSR